MERLGLGTEVLLGDNPRLVYGRMTGWGQTGPLAQTAGHDINYIAVSGALHTVGPAGGKLIPPVNYLGDFGGGGMLLAFGMVSALLAVRMGGSGQVIDAAMTDGSALLTGMTWALRAEGQWEDLPGVNLLDGGAHFYDTYACADGKSISVGAIEPGFYAMLRERLGLDRDPDFDAQNDRAAWPALTERLARLFASRSRDDWCALFEGTDACVAPVLSLEEAMRHPHNEARGTFVTVDGEIQPAPAPRFSRTTAAVPLPPGTPGRDTRGVLEELGYSTESVGLLRAAGAIG